MTETTRPSSAIIERHACGWSGPGWLHISGLCHSCKGVLPLAFGDTQEYAEPCGHRRCVKYRRLFGNGSLEER